MTTSTPDGLGLLGTLGEAGGKGVVRVEDRFEAALEAVWSALTEPGRLALWLGEVEGDLRPGGTFRARFHASGWEGSGRVEACEPPRRLFVLTRQDEGSDEGSIEVTLAAEDGGTAVVWEERGMPIDFVAAYGAGIQIHVEDLRDHLAGGDRRDSKERFERLFPLYKEVANPTS